MSALTLPASALRGRNWRDMTPAQIDALARAVPPADTQVTPCALCRIPAPGRDYDTETMRSQLEVDYAARLELLRRAGDILAWRYEAVTLHLGRKLSYTPDFLVIQADGSLELHETKGYWNGKNREKGWIKWKMAAQLYPWFRFVFVTCKDGSWIFRRPL